MRGKNSYTNFRCSGKRRRSRALAVFVVWSCCVEFQLAFPVLQPRRMMIFKILLELPVAMAKTELGESRVYVSDNIIECSHI